MAPGEKSPCFARPLGLPLGPDTIVPVEPPLADTIEPVEPPLVNDEIVAAAEFTRTGERGLDAFVDNNPIFSHISGQLYRCKAK